MSTVIVGGNKYYKHSAVEFLISKLTKLGPKKIASVFDSLPDNSISSEDLVKWLKKETGIPNMCIHILGVLYDEIAKQYIGILDEWIVKNPKLAKDLEFTETKEPKPSNYTSAVARLSNIKFKDLDVEVKGFCIKEPLVRLQNLLKWPITKFASIKVEDIQIPKPPTPPPESKGDLYTRILELQEKLKEWEEYYFQICHSIEILTDKLKNKSVALSFP